MSKTDAHTVDLAKVPALSGAAASAVVAALTRDGAEVRFVGGCVRDTLMDVAIGDVDLATPDHPETVMALLEDAGLKAVPTGLKHGTVTAVSDGVPFEITTLRVDVETDGRHAEVAFTDDWEADAARRDFTINAMSLAPDGTLHDYFEGRADLARGRVRFVGDARARIAEDYLRVLRFFRFLARLPVAEPDAEAVDACREAAGSLGRLSAERVRVELLKTLAAPAPVPAVELMRETGVLGAVLPEAAASAGLLALTGIDDADPVRRLAALAPDGGQAIARRLKMSNAERDRLAAIAPPIVALEPDLAEAELRQRLYDHGPAVVRDLVLLAWARDNANHAEAWRGMLDAANGWEPPELPLRGEDVVAAGVASGPEIGRLLRDVETWWRGLDFQPDRDACLAELKRHVERRP